MKTIFWILITNVFILCSNVKEKTGEAKRTSFNIKSHDNQRSEIAKTSSRHIKISRTHKQRKTKKVNDNATYFSKPQQAINANAPSFAQEHRIIKRNASFTDVRKQQASNLSLTTAARRYTKCERNKSCSGRCSINRTEWGTRVQFTCSCDPDCYEVFNDCCADYEWYCGFQTPKNVSTKKYKWTCERVGNIDSRYDEISEGIWMVSQCAGNWPDDDIRTKCKIPMAMSTASLPDLFRDLPVVSQDNITFRNHYCALCNNKAADPYEPWILDIPTEVTPPETYNITQKIQFLLSHGATALFIRPKSSHPRRYCVNNVINSCANYSKLYNSCTNGQTAVVTRSVYRHYKNVYCALCQGTSESSLSCFPSYVSEILTLNLKPRPFSLVLDFRQNKDIVKAKFSLQRVTCANKGMVFDEILRVCRINWLDPPDKNGPERYYVVAWLQQHHHLFHKRDLPPSDFQMAFADYFQIPRAHIFKINIKTIPSLYFQVSFTIVLTPQQSLAFSTTSAFKQRLLKLLYFQHSWMIKIGNLSYTIFKTTSRPLTCYGQKRYTDKEYTLLDNEKVYIHSTNVTYEKSQYFRENGPKRTASLGNITVCEKYIPTGCNATWTILAPKQFVIMTNLSIYNNETSMIYHYGQYDVLSNNSIAVCVSTYTKLANINKNMWYDKVLGWISFFGFLLSIVFLIFLLVTYFLFSQLRTLPGKNLMNLAATLLMFDLFWLLPGFSEVASNRSLCTVIAVTEHYFLLAYFASMSVIAFHTCKVFARQLPAPKSSKSHEKKLFSLYMFFVWLVPAIFVITCFLLDKKHAINLGYEDSEICWISKDAYVMFLSLPIAILLLCNTVAFVTSAIYLRKHGQNRAARQASEGRRSNLSIYIKLSTLMGFSWFFALLENAIKSPITVLWYLFVILTCLQGVFITIAFVVNTKTLKKYKTMTFSTTGGKNRNRSRSKNVETKISYNRHLETSV